MALRIATKTELIDNYSYGSTAHSSDKSFIFKQPDGSFIHIYENKEKPGTINAHLQNSAYVAAIAK